MMKLKLELFLTIFVFTTSGILHAGHDFGGYIHYKHDTSNRYSIYVNVYRDCRGTVTNPSVLGVYFFDKNNKTLGYVGLENLVRQNIQDVSILQTGRKNPCNPANTFATGTGTELHVFKTTIDFDLAPFSTHFAKTDLFSVVFIYSLSINNGILQGDPPKPKILETEMRVRDSKGNLLITKNSSPQVSMHNTNFICCNQEQHLFFGFQDLSDFDSLKYQLSPVKTGLFQYESYNYPYSYNYPVTSYCVPQSNFSCKPNFKTTPIRGFYFDTFTGIMRFTPVNCNERAKIHFTVTEYRNIKGTVEIIGKTGYLFILNGSDACGYNYPPRVVTEESEVTFAVNKPNKISFSSSNTLFSPYQFADTTDIFFPNAPVGSSYVRNSPFNAQDKGDFEWEPDEKWLGKKFRLVYAVKDRPVGMHPTYMANAVTINFRGKRSDYKLTAFLDKNNNGVKDSAEPVLPNVPFGFKRSNGKTRYLSTDKNGVFQVFLYEGTATLSTIPGSNWFTRGLLDTLRFYGKDSVLSGFIPLHSLPYINGKLFYDFNSNCKKDLMDVPAQGVEVFSENSLVKTDDEGNFRIFLDTVLTSVYINTGKKKTTCSGGVLLKDVLLPIDTFIRIEDIGLKDFFDINVQYYTTIARRGRNFDFYIQINNSSLADLKYNTNSNYPEITLNYPKELVVKKVTNALNIDSTNGLISWKMDNIPGNYTSIIYGSFYVPPEKFVGRDKLNFHVFIDTAFKDYNPENNETRHKVVVLAPCDPNNKSLLTVDSLCVSEKAVYMIEFQNYGTDTAFQVVIKDSLDSRFDASTIELLHSSAPCTMDFRAGLLTFTFPDIMLPDTFTNLEKSKGFVLFKAGLKPNIRTPLTIGNSADIYFDFEAPVRTPDAVFHVIPNLELEVGKSKYCKKDTIEYSLINHINQSNINCIIYLDKMDVSGVTETVVVEKFTVNESDKWLNKRMEMAENAQSGHYRLRLEAVGFENIGFIKNTREFYWDNTKPEWSYPAEICKNSLVNVNLKNESNGDFYIDGNIYRTQTSGIQFLADKPEKKIKVYALNNKECAWSDSAKITVYPLPAHKIAAPSRVCEGQLIKFEGLGEDFKTIIQNGITQIENLKSAEYITMPHSELDIFKIIFSNGHGCRDSVEKSVVSGKNPPARPDELGFSCNLDSLFFKYSGTHWYQIYQGSELIGDCPTAGDYKLKLKNGNPVIFSAIDEHKCTASDTVTLPLVEKLNLSLQISRTTVCAYDTFSIMASGASITNLYVNNKFERLMNEKVPEMIYESPGQYRYRLQQRDLSGCEFYSNSVDVRVWPKPVMPVIVLNQGILSSSASHFNRWRLNGEYLGNGDTFSYLIPQATGYYSVVVKNENGCFQESVAVPVNTLATKITGQNGTRIYPNPATGILNIFSKGVMRDIEICAIDGKRLLFVLAGNNQIQLSVHQFPRGIYTVRIGNTDGTSEVCKVTLE